MKLDIGEARVFVHPGTTDMRKAVNGLAALVQAAMEKDPFSGALFLFCGKTRKIIKAIYWDRNGFCLWQKRLERDRFPWPETEEAVRELSRDELRMLLEGIDFFHPHEEIRYKTAV